MKIKIDLHPQSNFMNQLKENFLEQHEFGMGHMIASTISPVMSAIEKTLLQEAKSTEQNIQRPIVLTLPEENYLYPAFATQLEENISAAFNHSVHNTTLERYVDLVMDFMRQEAQSQLSEKESARKLIDANDELQAITTYLTQTWDGFDKFDGHEFLEVVWEQCVDKTRNIYNQYGFTDFCEQWMNERKDYNNWKNAKTTISEKDFSSQLSKDAISMTPINIILYNMKLHDVINKNWDYEATANNILQSAKQQFPECSKVRPIGWKKNAKKSVDDSVQFTGIHSGTACSHPFQVRVSLKHVKYDDEEQGRNPLVTLVGAMLAHAYIMNEKNNSNKMLNELESIKEQYSEPQYYQNIVPVFEPQMKEPLNQALFLMLENGKNSIPDIDNTIKALLDIKSINNKKNKLR